jgi:hypothetical protein
VSQTSHDAKAVVRALDALTEQVRRIADALTTGADDEAPTPATTTADDGPRCVQCGSPDVRYRNYREQPFCWPCANGEQQAPAADEAAPNMLRVLADRAARGVLSEAEGEALRRRTEQMIAGRATWKAKAEEIEQDRNDWRRQAEKAARAADLLAGSHRRAEQLAAVLREVLDTFSPMRDAQDGPVAYYDGSADIDPERYERWRAALDGAEQPTTETAERCCGKPGGAICIHDVSQPKE